MSRRERRAWPRRVVGVWLVLVLAACGTTTEASPDTSSPATPTSSVERSDEDASDTSQAPIRGRWPTADEVGPTAYVAPDLDRPLDHEDLRPSDSIVTTHDGEVIERLDVTGTIEVAHDDVVIRAVRVRTAGGHYGISAAPDVDVARTTVEFVEVDGGGDVDGIGVLLGEVTVRRSDIHGQRVGIQLRGGSTIEHNRVYDQATGPGTHNTAVSIHGGSGVVIRGNDLEGSTSAALSLYPRLEPLRDILVTENLFNGGSYCTYGGATDHEYRDESRDIRYVENVFGTALHDRCGEFGPVSNFDGSTPGNEWVGNTWQDTGEQVP